MTWTKTLPTVAGWYWVRRAGRPTDGVARVVFALSRNGVMNALVGLERWRWNTDGTDYVGRPGVEWYGPLTPPE